MMNKDLFTLLNTVKVVDVVVTTCLFILIIGLILSQKDKLKEFMETWRKRRNFEDTIIESIDKLKDVDANLKNGICEVWDILEESQEVSKEIRSKMFDDIKTMSDDLKIVIGELEDMKEKNRLSKKAELKERIERIYWECHKNMTCTDTAFETLKDLIDDYERYGGENSFVHSLVLPEMYEWKRIKNIPASNGGQNDNK